MKSQPPVHILIADDDQDDCLMTREAFAECRIGNPLHFVHDGEALLDYLRRHAPYDDEELYPLPGLILLDLNMPRMDGREFLSIVKTDAKLKRIPVLIMSTSDSPRDVLTCYELQANAYIAKPLDIDDFITLVESIRDFWCRFAQIPPKS